MERSFDSVRQGVNRIADRWARSSRVLKKEDQKYGEKLAKLAKMYSRGSFFGCDDPLEAVLFSVLIEMIKRQETRSADVLRYSCRVVVLPCRRLQNQVPRKKIICGFIGSWILSTTQEQ
jgi:hypothetical protein